MNPLIVAASAAILLSAAPLAAAAAEDIAVQTGVYASLGYADVHSHGANLGAIEGRLGYRFNPWLGVEGELAAGVMGDDFSLSRFGFAPIGHVNVKSQLTNEEAIYGVGFLPIAPNWDLIGRVGYGHASIKLKDVPVEAGFPTSLSLSDDSWNYGVGAQFRWDAANGVRADYTRHEFNGGSLDHADVWALAFNHQF